MTFSNHIKFISTFTSHSKQKLNKWNNLCLLLSPFLSSILFIFVMSLLQDENILKTFISSRFEDLALDNDNIALIKNSNSLSEVLVTISYLHMSQIQQIRVLHPCLGSGKRPSQFSFLYTSGHKINNHSHTHFCCYSLGILILSGIRALY